MLLLATVHILDLLLYGHNVDFVTVFKGYVGVNMPGLEVHFLIISGTLNPVFIFSSPVRDNYKMIQSGTLKK